MTFTWHRSATIPALATLATMSLAVPAYATAVTTADIFSQFNAVVFGSFFTTSDVEGRTVIGGTMTGGATFDLNPGNAAASSFSALTVYGNQTGGNTFNVNNGGGVAIAGTNSGSFTLNGGGNASVGGANTGNLNAGNGAATISVGGANSGNLTAGGSSSVYVGGANSANINVNGGSGSIAVVGPNAATVTLNNGGSVYLGGNSGNVSVNGGPGSVAVNAGNSGTVTLNNGGTATINGNTGNVNLNSGSLTYTGNRNGNVNLNGGATAQQVGSVALAPPAAPSTALPGFASTFQAPLTALSSSLDALGTNSTASRSGNSVTFSAIPDITGLAVFDVGSSLFAANSTVTLQLNSATSVIINVNIDSCALTSCAFSFPSSVNFSNPTSYADKVLWNFANATSLAFPNAFGGSVLAPYAAISNQGPIDGTVVAASFSGNGELHSRPFTGILPNGELASSTGSSLVVPEPTSLAVIGGGLAALGALRRRKK